MMRAMIMEFPNDPACDTLDRQYMLGGSLLVAPVFSEDGSVDYYLPKGRWTHLLSGEVREGGRWHRAVHDFLSLPLFVKSGAVLGWGAINHRPDYGYAEGITFRIYQLEDGGEATCLVGDQRGRDALKLTARRNGKTVTAVLEGDAAGEWRVELVGIGSVNRAVGGSATKERGGVVIQPAAGQREIRVELAV